MIKRIAYQLWNYTDQVFASPDTFKSRELAQAYAGEFRKRFLAQGFYRTTEGVRIAPEDLKLVIVASEGKRESLID